MAGLSQWSCDNLFRVSMGTWRQASSPASTVRRTFDDGLDAVGRGIEVADFHAWAPNFSFLHDVWRKLHLRGRAGTGFGAV